MMICLLLIVLILSFGVMNARHLQKVDTCQAVEEKGVRTAKKHLNVSMELMGPHSYRLASDVYYGPIIEYDMTPSEFPLYHSRYLPHLLPCLKPGVVIYVKNNWLPDFFTKIYPQINVPFVLVSGNSDDSNPNGLALAHFLEPNSKILHWYAINCVSNPDPLRFTCVPIGVFDNDVWSRPQPDSLTLLTKNFSTHLVIANHERHNIQYGHVPIKKELKYDILLPRFNFGTHPDRPVVWQQYCGTFSEKPTYLHTNNHNITTLCASRILGHQMFTETIRSRFVISPHGMGLDCYRTWESLYLGAYVIVKKSSLDELYRDLPVLILDSWTDLTLETLNAAYEKFSATKYTYDTLRESYWRTQFHSHGNYTHLRYSVADPAALQEQALIKLNLKNGDLIMGQNKMVYLIANSTKCPIYSGDIFMSYPGWEWGMVKHFTDFQISDLFDGPPLPPYSPPT